MLPGQESVEHPYIFSVAVEQLVRLPDFVIARGASRRPEWGKPGDKKLPAPGHVAGGASGRGDIALQRVVHDHAVRVKAPA